MYLAHPPLTKCSADGALTPAPTGGPAVAVAVAVAKYRRLHPLRRLHVQREDGGRDAIAGCKPQAGQTRTAVEWAVAVWQQAPML